MNPHVVAVHRRILGGDVVVHCHGDKFISINNRKLTRFELRGGSSKRSLRKEPLIRVTAFLILIYCSENNSTQFLFATKYNSKISLAAYLAVGSQPG